MKTRVFFRILAIAILAVASFHTLRAATYTLESVPNVHLADTARFVTNPDGIISTATERWLDRIMSHIRRATTAEPVIVVIDDFEGDDIDDFATGLFESWGLGKEDMDNGLLILVAKDRRKAVIRPGYGLEGVLTDMRCGQLLRELMFPAFARGDYDNGLLNAATAIESVLTDPDAAAEIFSSQADADNRRPGLDTDGVFSLYIRCAAFIGAIMLLVLLYMLWHTRGRGRHERYVALVRLKPLYLALTFIGLGIPLAASLPLILLLQHWRNSPRRCQRCGTKMNKLDEATDNLYLNAGQDIEEQLGAVDYDVWLCPKCGETDIEPYLNHSSAYKQCPRCGVRAYGLRAKRILAEPTTRSEGRGVRQMHCFACGYDHDEHYTIPRKTDDSALLAATAIGLASGRRGGGFGGGSFGGGFGGGSTGGGGASGGW